MAEKYCSRNNCRYVPVYYHGGRMAQLLDSFEVDLFSPPLLFAKEALLLTTCKRYEISMLKSSISGIGDYIGAVVMSEYDCIRPVHLRIHCFPAA